MKFKLVINKNAEEEITAVVHERTEIIDAIEHLVIHEGNPEEFYGYDKDIIKILKIQEIESIFAQDNKTYVSYADGRQYSIKLRLYEIEPKLPDYHPHQQICHCQPQEDRAVRCSVLRCCRCRIQKWL